MLGELITSKTRLRLLIKFFISQANRGYLNGVYNDFKVTTLSVGDSHTINQGPFSGVTGKVVETNNTKVKLELACLGMQITLKKQAA